MNYIPVAASVISGLVVILSPLQAIAQSSQLRPFPVGIASRSVTISVNYQFFLSGSTESVADQTALVDQGRRHLYMLLAKECEVLLETIASDCKMSRVKVDARIRQIRAGRPSNGVRVAGSANYSIKLAPKSTKAAEE